MTDVRSAYDPNRLPWLSEPAPQGRARRAPGWQPVLLGGLLALILVAALGYWAGLRSVSDIESAANAGLPDSMSTPAPSAPPSAPAPDPRFGQVQPMTPPALRPVTPPPMARIERPRAAEPAPAPRSVPAPEPATVEPSLPAEPAADPAAAAAMVAAPAATVTQPLPAPRPVVQRPATTLWPADRSDGAAGRAVRIGTYRTRLSAKRAWQRVVRTYPGMRRLKAVVVPIPSLRNGRTYYRLQFGTTSQAHSAVLCQRMRIVGQSCVVVGAPTA